MITKKSSAFFQECKQVAAASYSTRVVRYFPDTDLRCNHLGLSDIAKKHNIDVRNLKPGEFCVFVNKRETALKIFAPQNTLVYLKSPGNYPLDLRVVKYIPRFFNGTAFNYPAGLRQIFEERGVA